MSGSYARLQARDKLKLTPLVLVPQKLVALVTQLKMITKVVLGALGGWRREGCEG